MKNKMMRIASILMVAVLLTVCAVSSTFAKYVTSVEVGDAARVAKWGIVITAENTDLFAEKYAKDDTTYAKDYTVIAADEAKVVAPGTKSDADKPFTLTVTGAPEVAFRTAFTFGDNFKDVFLKKGTYTDYTKLVKQNDGTYAYGTFELTDDYYPIVYTITENDTQIFQGTLDELKTALASKDYDPQTAAINSEFVLSWEWKFEKTVAQSGDAAAEVDPITDAADTLLGNIAAGVLTADELAAIKDKYSVEVALDLAITVTQID
ncbi:MAG: hypothetical protein ILP01_02360 [Clostridia bacterium]|nr:hypothetical protein [Clostridia bacterium]